MSAAAGSKAKILVVDDEQGAREALQVILEDDYEVTAATSGAEALEVCNNTDFDLIFLDVSMPGMDGLDTLRSLKEKYPALDVIMISASDRAQKAVQSIKLGAYDYITKPFEPDDILSAVNRVIEKQRLEREVSYLRAEVANNRMATGIVSRDPVMLQILELIDKVAKTSSSVLITGESGTGKELVARSLHYRSDRSKGPFVAINCAAIPSELMESELFGHEKGAFTGAHTRSIGKFEYADGGTLFLDEISTLRLELQAKLLRVIQQKELERVGSTRTVKVDVRIVAATNTNLEKMIQQGTFRQDLYFRLNVIPIKLPPLRARQGDVRLLAEHFLHKFNVQLKRRIPGFTERCLQTMERYHWPGNIRELENLVERLVVLGTDGEPITHQDLPLEILLDSPRPAEAANGEIDGLLQARGEFERQFILKALKRTGWNQSEAARLLKIHRNTLLQKMKALGISEATAG